MKKKLITRILLVLIACTVIATIIAYFVYQGEKPLLAFFIACCGAILVVNFSVTLFLIRKNFKK
ncbi:hypothetical protein [Massilibacteroides sp.]|uniref:hypothetical protein n=1 Tax=Massilibacteroides sp. TaxID=2034766 RepID=UPI00260DA92E|nr:hypothetical protein [Massilibacteroides sp.]MDD4515553.1 hypothetical protein [Massilibacteroides sp.]